MALDFGGEGEEDGWEGEDAVSRSSGGSAHDVRASSIGAVFGSGALAHQSNARATSRGNAEGPAAPAHGTDAEVAAPSTDAEGDLAQLRAQLVHAEARHAQLLSCARESATSQTLAIADDVNSLWDVMRHVAQSAIDRAAADRAALLGRLAREHVRARRELLADVNDLYDAMRSMAAATVERTNRAVSRATAERDGWRARAEAAEAVRKEAQGTVDELRAELRMARGYAAAAGAAAEDAFTSAHAATSPEAAAAPFVAAFEQRLAAQAHSHEQHTAALTEALAASDRRAVLAETNATQFAREAGRAVASCHTLLKSARTLEGLLAGERVWARAQLAQHAAAAREARREAAAWRDKCEALEPAAAAALAVATSRGGRAALRAQSSIASSEHGSNGRGATRKNGCAQARDAEMAVTVTRRLGGPALTAPAESVLAELVSQLSEARAELAACKEERAACRRQLDASLRLRQEERAQFDSAVQQLLNKLESTQAAGQGRADPGMQHADLRDVGLVRGADHASAGGSELRRGADDEPRRSGGEDVPPPPPARRALSARLKVSGAVGAPGEGADGRMWHGSANYGGCGESSGYGSGSEGGPPYSIDDGAGCGGSEVHSQAAARSEVGRAASSAASSIFDAVLRWGGGSRAAGSTSSAGRGA